MITGAGTVGMTVKTIAGMNSTVGSAGSGDGIGSVARFNDPYGIAVDR
jgi:hypothetical protein